MSFRSFGDEAIPTWDGCYSVPVLSFKDDAVWIWVCYGGKGPVTVTDTQGTVFTAYSAPEVNVPQYVRERTSLGADLKAGRVTHLFYAEMRDSHPLNYLNFDGLATTAVFNAVFVASLQGESMKKH